MDHDSRRSVALLSIHPKYATQLLNGTKLVEFRKRRFKEEVQWVVIYASSPVQRVIGYFSVAGFVEGSPSELWEQYKDVGGISEKDFWQYYQSCSTGVAIIVEDPSRLDEPVELSQIASASTPPQSFLYLSDKEFNRLRNSSKLSVEA